MTAVRTILICMHLSGPNSVTSNIFYFAEGQNWSNWSQWPQQWGWNFPGGSSSVPVPGSEGQTTGEGYGYTSTFHSSDNSSIDYNHGGSAATTQVLLNSVWSLILRP